ncbi:hypothetical protein [Amycolatopsis sp. FDAARGOS 1241]|nr:hypothetical protein [Amycolatopsis sp. FDAARGOS 1241]QRP42760.1 hypothetical protein I6J71_25100 [Amycolatopsis sp. FDAARGOS 1241]
MGVSDKHLAYREQLGVAPGDELPSSVGSTSAASTTSRRLIRAKPSKVEV